MDKLVVYLNAQSILGSVLLVLDSGIRTVESMLFVSTALVLLAEMALVLQVL